MLLDELNSDDPTTRALAIQQVRQTDLDDLDTLRAMLVACNDSTALPDSMQPPVAADPFADFFGQTKAAPKRATLAESACERLIFTGVIGKPETLGLLAEALQEPGEPMVKAVAKVLGETQWADRLEATRTLVPLLHKHQAALYEVVVRFGSDEHAIMIESALNPYNSRAVNELLNHAAAKPEMEQALHDAVLAGSITEGADAADILTLMIAWDSPHANAIAVALEPAHPWALLVRAVDEPAAGPLLRTWLAEEHPAPAGLVRKLQEGLKTRDDLPHFPLDAWLTYAGTGIDVVRQWGAAARCKTQLEYFVNAWQEAPERAWEATLALVEGQAHQDIHDAVMAGLARDTPDQWNRALFEALATAEPRFPDLAQTLQGVLLRHPLLCRAIVPALLRGYAADELRPVAEAYIEMCEARPVIEKPSRAGLKHEEREGVDPVPLQALVNFLGDEALTKRLEDVLPYVRAV